MKILDKNSIINTTSTVATIGFFDGFHLGHKFLINKVINFANENNKKSLVVTFGENPKKFFKKDNYDIRQLSTVGEKCSLLESFGVDYCLMLEFNEELSRLTAMEFLEWLKEHFSLSVLFIGYDHTFGSDKIRDFDKISKICQNIGIKVFNVEQFSKNNHKVSSTTIRKMVQEGNFDVANDLLGYTYTISGRVVEGQKIGRTIGFPTANIDVSKGKLVPKNGVYAVEVIIDQIRYGGMLNIGNRPTVCGINQTVEVNIFDFDQDIYGKNISVGFRKFIRDEKKFTSLDELKNQLFIDKQIVIDLLKGN